MFQAPDHWKDIETGIISSEHLGLRPGDARRSENYQFLDLAGFRLRLAREDKRPRFSLLPLKL